MQLLNSKSNYAGDLTAARVELGEIGGEIIEGIEAEEASGALGDIAARLIIIRPVEGDETVYAEFIVAATVEEDEEAGGAAATTEVVPITAGVAEFAEGD